MKTLEIEAHAHETSTSITVKTHLFALPALLPEQTRVLLDAQSHAAIVFSLSANELLSSPQSYPLTPSATRVLFRLLHASPFACSYQDLFEALYPSASVQHLDRHLLVRPIRRALWTLVPLLRGLGLRAVSLRGQGYMLARATMEGEAADAHAGH